MGSGDRVAYLQNLDPGFLSMERVSVCLLSRTTTSCRGLFLVAERQHQASGCYAPPGCLSFPLAAPSLPETAGSGCLLRVGHPLLNHRSDP